MAKMRVHEIAKQLNLTSKGIITKLQEMGVEVKNHMSNIEESDSAKLLEAYRPKRAEAAKNQAREKQRGPEAHETAARQDGQRDERPEAAKSQPREDARDEPANARRERQEQQAENRREGQEQPSENRRERREQPSENRRERQEQPGEPKRERQEQPGEPKRERQEQPGEPKRDRQEQPGEPKRDRPRRNRSRSRNRGDGQSAQTNGGDREQVLSEPPDRPQAAQGGIEPRSAQPRENDGQSERRREGQQGGQRRERLGQPTAQRREGQQGVRRRDGETSESPRREGQPSLSSGRQNARDGQRREGQSQGQGSFQRREGQQGQGSFQRREGQSQGSFQRRDGQQSQGGGFQRRDGQQGQGSFQRRDGQQGQGSFQRRDGQQGQGSFQRRDGQQGQGSFQRRDGQQSQGGSFQRRDGQQGTGFQRRDGGTGGPARPGFRPGGGGRPTFGKKDDKKPDQQPTKDDRRQSFQKSEQGGRIEKAKVKKEPGAKEGRSFYEKVSPQKRGGQRKNKEPKKVIPKAEPDISLIKIPQTLTVKELAEALHRSGADVVKALMKLGVMASVSQEIDFDTAVKAGESFNVIVEEAIEVDPFEAAFLQSEDPDEEKSERPPVVVVMGHVDHGKTSLLDAIRSTRVTESEAGGITQHIGAYSVEINGKPITFLDTPGHEAFTAMRMRGAQVTDIAVLVVAADDGVMPQTVEAINHAKAAGVDIIVAVNKIDKPGANPDRVKQELTEHGILVEDWGGETICVNVSALQHTNIDQLLEMIIIASEMKELRANPNKPARGAIVEARLDKSRGAVATVLVQDGTLKVGDTVVAGACFGKVRAMSDDQGRKIKEAGPAFPAEILGLADVPTAGDAFYVAQNEKQARMLSDTVIAKNRVSMIKAMPQKVSLDDLFSQIQAGSVKELNIVLKADVQGSVEAVRTSLEKISTSEVRVQVIHAGAGAVNESDVMLASASGAIIIGFNVRPDANAKAMADAQKVDLRLYRVIYNAIEDIEAAMKGMLDPVFQEKVVGHAEIRQIFRASGVGTIGGSYVVDGKITRGTQIRIVRDGKVVYDGTLETLRRFKDDAREVNAGYECGLLFSKFNDIKEGDMAEAYMMEEIQR